MVRDAFSAFNLYAHSFIKDQWTFEPLGVGKLEFNSSYVVWPGLHNKMKFAVLFLLHTQNM